MAINWTPRGHGEEVDKRTFTLFKAWQPSEGLEFQGFWDYADGDGGVAIAEVSSAEVILEAIAPWATYFEFRVRPLVASEQSVPIVEAAQSWRDSIT